MQDCNSCVAPLWKLRVGRTPNDAGQKSQCGKFPKQSKDFWQMLFDRYLGSWKSTPRSSLALVVAGTSRLAMEIFRARSSVKIQSVFPTIA